ncbi:MAG: DUF2029 domain-containing protein [Phycisphaerales bacterium]|nr:MAG: DUF2029 domain-containing protein [Phycisphaerales bacterium]
MTRASGRTALALVLLGVLIRLAAVTLSSPAGAPRLSAGSWPGDHAAYVLWARHAVERGIHDLYAIPPAARVPTLTAEGVKSASSGGNAVPNYPPLALYLVALEGQLLQQVDPQMIANTVAARWSFALFGVIGDVLLALGVGRLASQVVGVRARVPAAIACWLLPPIWLDSCWWGQSDSWVLAPLVWMLAAMVGRRWLPAGALWGVALALKPQALLAAPVWLFALVVERRKSEPRASARADSSEPRASARADSSEPRASARADVPAQTGLPDSQRVDSGYTPQRWSAASSRNSAQASARGSVKILGGGIVALTVLMVTSLGFVTHDGWAWLEQSYLRNLADEWPRTTLAAFNVWYVDLLLTFDVNVHAALLGVSRDAWGKALTLAALAAVWWLARRRALVRAVQYVTFAALWLLAVATVATRVHERYIVMCLPLLCVLAWRGRRAAAAVAMLALAASFQMTHHTWLKVGADAWSTKIRPRLVRDYEQAAASAPDGVNIRPLDEALREPFSRFRQAHRPYAPLEWLLTLGMLASTAWAAREVTRPPDAAAAVE